MCWESAARSCWGTCRERHSPAWRGLGPLFTPLRRRRDLGRPEGFSGTAKVEDPPVGAPRYPPPPPRAPAGGGALQGECACGGSPGRSPPAAVGPQPVAHQLRLAQLIHHLSLSFPSRSQGLGDIILFPRQLPRSAAEDPTPYGYSPKCPEEEFCELRLCIGFFELRRFRTHSKA
jgi:hypothetical protein